MTGPAPASDAPASLGGGEILLLAGPTASGKSALALALAEATGGEIVDADSMQVYRDLDILTARPSPADLARAPHHLYGFVDAAERYSVGRWSRDALAALRDIAARGRPAIVTGGTGLYFMALTEGLAETPDPGPEAQAQAREALESRGIEGLRALALGLDPEGAGKVAPADRQRLLRLVAVALGTGTPLSQLRAGTAPPDLPGRWRGVVLEPPKDALEARIATRAQVMIDEGGPEEAARLAARGLALDLPAMKALGVAALAALAAGRIGRDEANARLVLETRQYAKRQRTWFRNRTPGWARLESPEVAPALAAWRGQAAR